jgi:hypothetical protein
MTKQIFIRGIPNGKTFNSFFDTTTSFDTDDYKRTGKANPALKRAFAEEKKEIKGKMTLLKKNVVEKRLDLKVAVEKVEKFKNIVDSFSPPRVQTEKQKAAADKKAAALVAKAQREADMIVKKARIERMKQEKKDERANRIAMGVEDKKSRVRAKTTTKSSATKTKTARVKQTEAQKLAKMKVKQEAFKLLMGQLG